MMPSLKLVRSGLRRTTESLAAELALARPGTSHRRGPISNGDWLRP